MVEKNSNKKVVILAILFLVVVLLFVAYILYDQGILFQEESQGKQEEAPVQEESKIEELAIDTGIVPILYNKVVSGTGEERENLNYWMYREGEGQFQIDSASEQTKMYFVGLHLNTVHADILNCSTTSIPDTIPSLNEYVTYSSACYYNNINDFYSVEYAFSRSYVEAIYYDLFGTLDTFDLSVFIDTDPHGGHRYFYNQDLDMYVMYMTETGGTSGPGSVYSVTKAEKEDKVIRIYESSTPEEDSNDMASSYVYTFEQDEDGLYHFVSRVRES